MSRLSLIERLRLSHVSRWHIVRVANRQSVAEHTYRVWLIVNELCRELEISTALKEAIGQAALLHDLPEVIIGDIPTPTKARIGTSDFELGIDEEVDSAMRSLELCFPLGIRLIKLADMMESINFLDIEALGNHANEVCFLIRQQLSDYYVETKNQFPHYRWDRVSVIISQVCKGA